MKAVRVFVVGAIALFGGFVGLGAGSASADDECMSDEKCRAYCSYVHGTGTSPERDACLIECGAQAEACRRGDGGKLGEDLNDIATSGYDLLVCEVGRFC